MDSIKNVHNIIIHSHILLNNKYWYSQSKQLNVYYKKPKQNTIKISQIKKNIMIIMKIIIKQCKNIIDN
jgi:uncharacterized membrane protein YwzB